MSAADVLKHLKVKASSVKRLHKELSYYESERDKEQAKVDAMRAGGADASDLKQAVSVRPPLYACPMLPSHGRRCSVLRRCWGGASAVPLPPLRECRRMCSRRAR